MKKIILLLLIMLSVSGCQSNNEINMGGSSSVLPLIENIKNDYQTLHNNIVVTYDGSGSSKGIEGVKNNIYQFGFLSRDLSAKEQEDHLNVKLLAYDGIALIVNPRNPINNLTTAQIKAIYSGTITNWQQVGGRDLNISLIARDDASGTRQAFDQIIGIKDLSEKALLYDSNGAIAQAIMNNENAIGYVSFDTINRNKNVIKPLLVDNIAPQADNIFNKSYILYRPFLMVYYQDKLNANAQEFLQWLNQNLKSIITNSDFIYSEENNE